MGWSSSALNPNASEAGIAHLLALCPGTDHYDRWAASEDRLGINYIDPGKCGYVSRKRV